MPTNVIDRTLELATQIQQIPAPTFEETERATFIRDRFAHENLTDVEIDSLGNVFARWPGGGDARPIVISAHSDTVFPRETRLRLRREADKLYGPGIGDNSLGVAGLFGVLWQLRAEKAPLPGDLWLAANVGEEGLGNLRGMRAVVDRFGAQPRAYIVLEGMAYGEVFHRGLGVRRYRITARTAGGHSWADYGAPSAIHALAELITKLTALQPAQKPRTSLNVGIFRGGTSVNTIAAEASLELDLRSEEPHALQNLAREVESLVAESTQGGVNFEAEVIGERPAGSIPKDHPLVQLAVAALAAQGTRAHLNIGSTDANIPLSLGLPAVCLGLTHGRGAHTLEEFVYPAYVAQGVAQVATVVRQAFAVLG